MSELLNQLWQWVIEEPFMAVGLVVGIVVSLKLALWLLRFVYKVYTHRTLVRMRITMPRQDSPKDKDKDVEKDFREKIAIMEQFFRNIHEIHEINLRNLIKTKLFKSDIVSFEIIANEKIVDFYIVTTAYYQQLLEKQITSYYSDAEIEIVEPYNIAPKGSFTKCYFAYLKKKYWFPIKTYKTVENDPLNNLTNIFSKFKNEDKGAIQIVIRPHSGNWQKKATKFASEFFKGKAAKTGLSGIPVLGWIISGLGTLVHGYSPEKADSGGYVRMLQPKEEVAKQMGEKAQQVGFDAVIRIIGTSDTKEKAQAITDSLILSFNLFHEEAMNSFQTRRIVPIDAINNKIMLFHFNKRVLDLFPVLNEFRSLMVPRELASLFHLPHSKYNFTPIIRWLKYKVLPPPYDLPAEGILLGKNVYRGAEKEIRFLKNDRTRHQYIIGKSGSGKSAFISFMARQDIQNGEGVCVIDPHGDLVEDILTYIPKERAKDVIIFNPADQERPMGLNMLEASSPEQQDLASSQATEIFIKLFGDEIFGPRIQHYFRNACLTLMEDPDEGATLIDVPRMFVDDDFMKYKVSKVKNPVVKSFWEHEYANTGDRERQEMIPYFSSKFGPFITNTIMRNTIGQQKSGFDFRKVMDEQKVLLVNLSKGKIGDLNTQLLGLVMVARIQQAAMSRADIHESERKDFYLYVDEFQNFATDSFCSILSEARKYHLCLIMAHQYINQLVVSKYGTTSSQIRDAVFGNVGTLMSFKVGADDAEYLAKEYAPTLTEQDVIGISNYKAYIRLNINNTTSRPFSMSTIWDTTGSNKNRADIIKKYSRMKYGRKREFVDQEIQARIGIDLTAD
ncbi:MAG: type IV secretion system DNA-binding domain-containing protein [Patescibacteria group bacterium]|nr:type IV secretion system DNA-binding domain-containing protein [Patescibacteria group bacterium]